MKKLHHPNEAINQFYIFHRAFATQVRINGQLMSLYKNGQETIKQPVFVSDVAQAIVNAARDPDTRGQTYQAIG